MNLAWTRLSQDEKDFWNASAKAQDALINHVRDMNHAEAIKRNAEQLGQRAAKRLKTELLAKVLREIASETSSAGLGLASTASGLAPHKVADCTQAEATAFNHGFFGHDENVVPNPPGSHQPDKPCHLRHWGVCQEDRCFSRAQMFAKNLHAMRKLAGLTKPDFPIIVRINLCLPEDALNPEVVYYFWTNDFGKGETQTFVKLQAGTDADMPLLDLLDLHIVNKLVIGRTSQMVIAELLLEELRRHVGHALVHLTLDHLQEAQVCLYDAKRAEEAEASRRKLSVTCGTEILSQRLPLTVSWAPPRTKPQREVLTMPCGIQLDVDPALPKKPSKKQKPVKPDGSETDGSSDCCLGSDDEPSRHGSSDSGSDHPGPHPPGPGPVPPGPAPPPPPPPAAPAEPSEASFKEYGDLRPGESAERPRCMPRVWSTYCCNKFSLGISPDSEISLPMAPSSCMLTQPRAGPGAASGVGGIPCRNFKVLRVWR